MNDVIKWTKQEILHDKMNNEQIYHVWEGYLRKIPVEKRKISRAEWRGELSLKIDIFRKYPSQT
jgi:hypothetical protein